MKPIIGISVNYQDNTSRVANAYVQAVAAAGGVPVLIPLFDNEQILEELVSQLDGLLLTGGADIDPCYFDEKPIPELGTVVPERDTYDWRLITYARRNNLPILGICRGMQILNVHFGGTLFQDLAAQVNNPLLTHDQGELPRSKTIHPIGVENDSLLATILNANTLNVNSFHHQAVKNLAPDFRQSATAPDGVCEAIESLYYPILGVQWHPENLATSGDKAQQRLFDWLISEAKIQQQTRTISMLDSHCDTPMVYTEGMNFGQRNEAAQVDFVKMHEGHVGTEMMAAYIPQGELTEQATEDATKLAFDTINLIRTQVEKNSDLAAIATSPGDIEKTKLAGKIAIVPVIENGYAIGTELDNIDRFYNLGVRYITLCHNGDNQICDSASRSQQTHNGLSDFGRKVVAKMNKLGIMVDLSHAGEKTFWDVLECSTKPVICSHSSARALCDHPRNLTDKQLKALAEKGGVCQVCLYDGFLTKNEGTASVKIAVKHIEHIVEVAGIEHVGVGSDFDGGGDIKGCRHIGEFANIAKELIRQGYSQENISKIMSGNLLRVWNECQTQRLNS